MPSFLSYFAYMNSPLGYVFLWVVTWSNKEGENCSFLLTFAWDGRTKSSVKNLNSWEVSLSEDQGRFDIYVIGSLTCWMIDCAEQKEEAVNMPVLVKHCIWKAMYVILIATFGDPQVGRAGEVSAGWDCAVDFK